MMFFYVLCLLYVLSTATVVCDLLTIILALYLEVSNNSICNLKNIFIYQFCSIHNRFSNTLSLM